MTARSGRIRALIFFGLAAVAGLSGATIIGQYRESALDALGPLRPVLVSTGALPGGTVLTPRIAERRLRIVRVPERFLTAGAISDPNRLIGLRPINDLPAGTMMTTAILRVPSSRPKPEVLARGRQPVEIQVTGASAFDRAQPSRTVDVVVASEPDGSGRARTYIAAESVPLLALRQAESEMSTGSATAVLALTRRQALELIRAESVARGIRLLPRPAP